MNLVGVQRSCTSNPLASHTESWFRNSKLRFQGQTEFTLPFSPYRSPNILESRKSTFASSLPSCSHCQGAALEQGAAAQTHRAVSEADICQGEVTDLLVSLALEILALSLLSLPGEVGVLLPTLGGGQHLILSSVSADIPAAAVGELWGQPPDSSAGDVHSRAASK